MKHKMSVFIYEVQEGGFLYGVVCAGALAELSYVAIMLWAKALL